MKKKIVITLSLVFALAAVAGAQKKMKPWTEWSEKEVNKMLNDSAWGQTQAETNTAEMFFTPTTSNRNPIGNRPLDSPTGSSTNDRSTQGALNQATNVNYRIRLLTARPIRQAMARRAQMQNPQLAEQLKAFAEQSTDKFIVVAVDYDSTDRRLSGPVMQVFNSANTGSLKNSAYLENKDGKRVFLQEYIAPINDGMGAKFVFPRTLNNEAFVNEKSGYLRFYSEMGKDIKLNMRFKISDMMFDGKLEY
ncbi:MAG: hypothetical protein HONDAALG_04474 [Gammaproteobacteria bacterium]|nr:hypothetical protein [Gammaproteobacteria bacterium]